MERNLGVITIYMLFKVVRLKEFTMGVSIDKVEEILED